MKITIDTKYEITGDANQYKLIEHVTSEETGKERLINRGYFQTLEGVIFGLIQLKVRESKLTDIKEIAALIRGVTLDIAANTAALTEDNDEVDFT